MLAYLEIRISDTFEWPQTILHRFDLIESSIPKCICAHVHEHMKHAHKHKYYSGQAFLNPG